MNGFVSIGGFRTIEGGHPFEEQEMAQAAASLPAVAVTDAAREKQGAAVMVKYATGELRAGDTGLSVRAGTGEPVAESAVLPAGPAEEEPEAAELPVRSGTGTVREEFTTLPAGPAAEEPVAEPPAFPAEMIGGDHGTEATALPAGIVTEKSAQESFCSEGGADGQQEEPAAGQADSNAGESLSAGETEEEKRAAHKAAEKKRKEEWEAARQAKKDAKFERIMELEEMCDEDVIAESIKKTGADTEKVTRRNMKDCVCEHIQTKCLEDADFARLTLYPGKSMINCFQYINRMAWEYVQDEMKANGAQPGAGRIQTYASDIPDDLCYQWAEDYFNDPEAEEDREKEEKFVPKPYEGTISSKTQTKKQSSRKPAKSAEKKPADKKTAEKKPADEKPGQEDESYGQLSLFSQLSSGDSAEHKEVQA